MRLLSGPENDHRHTPTPAPSGAYEWWYFDALSEDGSYAVVAIFFLGSPMTPYYKEVVNAKHPDPMDWCGVFFTLHERSGETWKERAYAYNLYRSGEFCANRPEVAVGGSEMTYDGAGTWSVSINERGLWGGSVKASLRFSMRGIAPLLSAFGKGEEATRHTWACIAPSCQVRGSIGDIRFSGHGYHDHNFGLLPFDEVDTWYWVYARLDCSDGKSRFCLLYYLPETMAPRDGILLLLDAEGNVLARPDQASIRLSSSHSGRYGFEYCRGLEWENETPDLDRQFSGKVNLLTSRGMFAEGSFYVRLPTTVYAEETAWGETVWFGRGEGMGEVFQPSRLCGPITSRAMWSRIRRRNQP